LIWGAISWDWKSRLIFLEPGKREFVHRLI
jgi:hypothetical protein